MGDVEEMIGELEEESEAEEPAEDAQGEEEETEEAFGLDLDKAWSSPDEDR